jgi:putative ABC transport system permease protein
MATPREPLRTLPLRYRALLRLLPSHVRDEHARELRDALASERPSTTALAVDVLRASPRAHWDVLGQDLTVAVRQFRRAPAFTLVAVLTLAIGIGGNVAFFSVVDGVLLRQLAFTNAHRLVDITEEKLAEGMRNFGISPANYRDLAQDPSFQASAVYGSRSATLRAGETRERISYVAVSADFFRVFLEPPLLGRVLRPEEDVAGATSIVVSFPFWQSALGGDDGVVGREVEVDGARLRVVGVMPEDFAFPNENTAFWQPLGLTAGDWQRRGARYLNAVALLRSGLPVDRAASAIEVAARRLASEHPRTNQGWSVRLRELRMARVGAVRAPLLFVWGAGTLVLLIAVANVASLFLTRAIAREREMALRTALGARAGRVVRQLVTEGFVVTIVGAVSGIVLAQLILGTVRPLAADFVPRIQEVHLGARAVAYTGGLVAVTTALLSVLAASPVRARRLVEALGSGRAMSSRPRRRRQRGMVVAEVAIAVFVLVGSALVVRTLVSLLSQPMGFDPRNVLTFRLEPPWRFVLDGPMDSVVATLTTERARATEAFETLTRELEALPGVQKVGAVNRLPLTGDWWTTGIRLPERANTESERIASLVRPVTRGYFQAMGTRVLRGRDIAPSDAASGEQVIVVDSEFANRIWAGADPLGREVLLDGRPDAPPPRARVVGVVETIHMNRLDAELRPTMYVPFAQALEGHYLNWGMDVVVRGGSLGLERDVRRVVRQIFPDAAVFRVSTMASIVAQSTSDRRFQLFVIGFFAVLALTLATVGIAGVLALTVSERRGALAVQMALGARPTRLWWQVQREGLTLVLLGCALGILGAVTGAQLFSSLVYGVSVRDPLALLCAPLAMLAAAFAAGAIPAARAVRVDPIRALRGG